MRKGRGNSPRRAGEEGGPRDYSRTQGWGDAAAGPTGYKRQLKARLCSPALARLRGPHSALRLVLSENTSRIPPVPSWIEPRLPVRFRVHLSRQEVPAAATVAPQPNHRRRRSSSHVGQPGFWCLAAVSGTRPRARHPSGRVRPSSLPASRPPPGPRPKGPGRGGPGAAGPVRLGEKGGREGLGSSPASAWKLRGRAAAGQMKPGWGDALSEEVAGSPAEGRSALASPG